MPPRLFDVLNRFVSNAKEQYRAILFKEDQFVETGEFNELQSILQREISALGDQTLGKISLREGWAYRIDQPAAKIILTKAVVWAGGYVHDVPAAEISIPLLGPVKIGIIVDADIVTPEDDEGLKGIAVGQISEGQDLANRLQLNARWAKEGDGEPFYPILTIEDGVPLKDVEAPFSQQIENPVERHIRESHGSHMVDDGLQVRWVGFDDPSGKQKLSIAKGAVRANGRLISKSLDTPFEFEELPKLETVNGEVHTFSNPDAGGVATIKLRNGPIASVSVLTVRKRVTQNIVHGNAGSSDALPLFPVVDIERIEQGSTVFVKDVDFRLGDGDEVIWLNSSTEPDPQSTTQMTWIYTDTVQPESVERNSLRVAGGYEGGQVTVNYDYKLPRLDLLCIDQDGRFVHLRGEPSRYNIQAPRAPAELAVLVKITNQWGIAPLIEEIGPRAMHEEDVRAFLEDYKITKDKAHQALLRTQAASRDPASERGWFSDNFQDDTQRDKGKPNTAAIVNGLLQLQIDTQSQRINLGDSTITLPYVSEVVLANDWRSTERKVNEYWEFNPTPGVLELDPPIDRWTEVVTTDLSSVSTARMLNGTAVTSTQLVRSETVQAQFLRPITVNYKASRFGPGEVLNRLTFDGQVLDLPDPNVVGQDGVFTGQFQIPAGVPAGAKLVELAGNATRSAAVFVGEGTITRQTWLTTTSFLAPIQESDEGDNSDPVAQSFALPQDRVLLGFDVEFTKRGNADNHLIGNLRLANEDKPTGPSLTEGIVNGDFTISETGQGSAQVWTNFAYRNPAPVMAGVKHCIGVLTEDANHSIAVSELGNQDGDKAVGFDERKQAWVTSQRLNGQFSDSPNHDGYVLHPTLDLTCRIHAARFTSNSRVVEIGQLDLDHISDMRVEALIFDFGVDTNVMMELVRANGDVIRFNPNEHLQLDEYLTEQVTLQMVLTGNELVSPLVSPDITVILGKLAETSVYNSQAIGVDVADKDANVRAIFEENTPGTSSLAITLDDNGIDATLQSVRTADLGDGWFEQEKALFTFDQPETSVTITLTGTPANRPTVRDLRIRATEIA